MKNFIFIISTAILLIGCAVSQNEKDLSNSMTEERNLTKQEIVPETGTDEYTLYTLSKQIREKLNLEQNESENNIFDLNQSILVSKTNKYVKVLLRDKLTFEKDSTIPKRSISEYIKPLLPILSDFEDVIVQVISHTSKKKAKEHCKVFTDKRAINIANLFLQEKIKNKVYAKGCSCEKPIMPYVSENQQEINRRIEIYFYPNEKFVINPCK